MNDETPNTSATLSHCAPAQTEARPAGAGGFGGFGS
jgi:hypothetical protein